MSARPDPTPPTPPSASTPSTPSAASPSPSSTSTSTPLTFTERAALVAFVVFVGAWLAWGGRQFAVDDSRWAFGMFPYVLEVQVERVEFVDAAGRVRAWTPPKKPRLPRPLRPGQKDETYGYGKGAFDALVDGVLVAAANDAKAGDVEVVAVVVTRRSERPVLRETRRLALPRGAP